MSILPGRETLACPRVLVRAHLGRTGFGPVLALGRPGVPAARVRVLAGVPVLAEALVPSRIRQGPLHV